ncbi:MAG: hypothetical protein HDR56_06335 [Treponema sp.]|nr:hypothetical protein [Treponema sp.]MBD5413605.1 hypothetical protein [Treponema sp.]
MITVEQTDQGAFSIQPIKATFYTDENMPNVIIRNLKNVEVQYSNAGITDCKTDDSNGFYSLRYIRKEVYDSFADEEKTDWKFMEDFVSNKGDDVDFYSPNENYMKVAGTYMLFAMIDFTHNYRHIITPAVEITIKDPVY